ncbi:hypothetical protein [Motilimonas cestriensis]|uniref:hypothetical protein n=1 Tax=Motilimonas cestriensis TaxID=2742685 RepID=UPI003DA644A9
MSKNRIRFTPLPVRNVGLLPIEIKPPLDRVVVMDRVSMALLFTAILPNGGLVNRIVPMQYAQNPNLVVIGFDDDGEYNAAIMDARQAQLVDANAQGA